MGKIKIDDKKVGVVFNILLAGVEIVSKGWKAYKERKKKDKG